MLEKFIISLKSPIRDIIEVINNNGKGVALVVDEGRRLLGTVTDGDIRRAILRGMDLDSPVELIMRTDPVTASPRHTTNELLALMNEKSIRHIPIIDSDNRLVDLVWISDLTKEQFITAKAVIMAGGYGRRLQPLTNDVPKPMLHIWGKPILEVIIEHLRDYGVRDFYITTRYKAEQIKKYFKDGSHLKLNINYVEEKKRLGTAGAISLIEDQFEKPFIVINSDILTKLNIRDMYNFHIENKAKMTVAVRKYDLQVPFGVVETEEEKVVGLSEKPHLEYFVNAGVYILNPEIKEMILYNKYLDITELIRQLIKAHMTVCNFPVKEYWIDVGRFTDFEKIHFDIINGAY